MNEIEVKNIRKSKNKAILQQPAKAITQTGWIAIIFSSIVLLGQVIGGLIFFTNENNFRENGNIVSNHKTLFFKFVFEHFEIVFLFQILLTFH